ncbi:hypothetical protein G6F40_015356 [Rhizopus arrhizus]|nr:hypothetical protein G6F40_015356 [Rhizopus arrhizus]
MTTFASPDAFALDGVTFQHRRVSVDGLGYHVVEGGAGPALILLAAVYVGAEYGGRITAILLNVPGEASAIMTTLDGYPLARQGMANVALSLSAWSAFFGAIVSVVGIILLAPMLAKWALAAFWPR